MADTSKPEDKRRRSTWAFSKKTTSLKSSQQKNGTRRTRTRLTSTSGKTTGTTTPSKTTLLSSSGASSRVKESKWRRNLCVLPERVHEGTTSISRKICRSLE